MNKSTSKENGIRGEDFAADMMRKLGFRIIARNYREKCGEIDLIAENGRILAFVEVKTRSKNAIASPAEAVHRQKQQKIIKTAMLYLNKNPKKLQPRFDVIEVYALEEGLQGRHIPGAFEINPHNAPKP